MAASTTRYGSPAAAALPAGRREFDDDDRRRRRGVLGSGRLIATAVLLGLLASGGMVWQGTAAVFSSTTSNSGSSWATGSVALSDDDTGSAMFSAAGLVPGNGGSNCITVSYGGDVATTVKLYVGASADASALAQYVNLVIQEGAGGGFGSCGGFASSATLYTGTLAAFTAAKTNYGNGVGTWAPSGAATKVYKISYTLDSSTPSSKEGVSTSATFTWEAQAGS